MNKQLNDAVACMAVLNNPRAKREDRVNALFSLERVLPSDRIRAEKSVETFATGIVRRFLFSKGASSDDTFMDINAAVYHDRSGWRVAIMVAVIQREDQVQDDLEDLMMEHICSELASSGLDYVVNDVCVNHLQRRGNKPLGLVVA